MKNKQPNGSPSILIPALIGVLLAVLLIIFCIFFISPWENSESIDINTNQEYNIPIEITPENTQVPKYDPMDEELRQGEPEG